MCSLVLSPFSQKSEICKKPKKSISMNKAAASPFTKDPEPSDYLKKLQQTEGFSNEGIFTQYESLLKSKKLSADPS
jgi:hypothetical protein